MSQLNNQIYALKEIYREIEKAGSRIQPIIIGKFALTVYTQGLYPSGNISLLFPDLNLIKNVLKGLGYRNMGDFWIRKDIAVEISKKFEIIPFGTFNRIEVDGEIINVISVEDLLIDMMNECIAGDDTVCDLIKLLIRSYGKSIDFHYIFQHLRNKKAVIKFKEFRRELN